MRFGGLDESALRLDVLLRFWVRTSEEHEEVMDAIIWDQLCLHSALTLVIDVLCS